MSYFASTIPCYLDPVESAQFLELKIQPNCSFSDPLICLPHSAMPQPVTAYLLSVVLLLSFELAQEAKLSRRSAALFAIAFLHFLMLSVNLFFFGHAERTDSDYFYDPDFGRYWRWA